MGRQDIADHLGLTIETISRSITALRAEGAVLVPNTHQLVPARHEHLARACGRRTKPWNS